MTAKKPAGIERSETLAVLLNRMSFELFSEKPFPEALQSAAIFILAILDAQHVAFYFCDELGLPANALTLGDARFQADDAQREERDAMRRAFAEDKAVRFTEKLSWLAAPLPRRPGEAGPEGGAVVVGWLEPQREIPARADALSDAARLIRNARIIQRDLQQRGALAAVVEQSPDAIVTTGLDDRVLSWNSAAQELFGFSRGEIIGREESIFTPEDRLEEARGRAQEARGSAHGVRFETVRKRKDGSVVPVEATYTTLKGADGAPISTVRIFRDITQKKQIERMKSDFISLVTHELRTPLTAIGGFAEALYEDPDVDLERRRTYLKVILDESSRLGKLVNDFLDISRLESGVAPPKRERLDLPAIAGRAEALFSTHASRARLVARFAPNATHAWGDPEQVYRLLINLCGNALKYSPLKGSVAVDTRRDGEMIEISVTDQGPGLSPEVRKRLFEKFFRAGDEVSRKSAGSGLGLAICRSIVEAHGGSIWAANAPSGGARFTFTIPAEPHR